jgi:hypothetical protein
VDFENKFVFYKGGKVSHVFKANIGLTNDKAADCHP